MTGVPLKLGVEIGDHPIDQTRYIGEEQRPFLMTSGARVEGFAGEGAEIVKPASRVRASDTRRAFGIVTAFAKLTDGPLDPFESVITVGFPVLLLVLRKKLPVMAIHNFVEHSTAVRTVWLKVYARFQRVCRAHTLEYRPSCSECFSGNSLRRPRKYIGFSDLQKGSVPG